MSTSRFLAVTVWIFVLTGCGAKLPIYIPKRAAPLAQDHAQYTKTTDNVTVMASRLDPEETKELFGKQGRNLTRGNKNKYIYPIQLTIRNQSDHAWILDRHNISLPTMSHREVADRLFVVDNNRALLYSALGMSASTLLFGAGLGCMFAGKIAAAYATKAVFYTGVGLTTAAAIPATLCESHNKQQAQSAYETNSLIFEDIQYKVVPYTCTIHPNIMLNAFIFVKARDWRPNFTVTLLDQWDESQKLHFTINLEEKLWRQNH